MRRLTAVITALVIVAALFSVTVRPVAAQGTGTTYVVQPGDNLYRIGLKFGLSVIALSQANGIVNPNFVYVGQKLIIPAGAQLPTVTTAPATVIPLFTPTTAFGTPASTLIGTSSASPTQPTIDAGIITATSISTATHIPTIVPTATATDGTGGPIPTSSYTVVPGDNLYRISLKFKTTMLILMQLNNISNANVIYVGQNLSVPAPAAASGTPTPAASVFAPGGTAVATSVSATMAATAAGTATVTNTAGNAGFAYGIVVDMTGQDATKLTGSVTDLGTTWVKLPVSWKQLEPTKGNVDSTALDAQVTALNSANVKILLTISGAPDWARPASVTAENGPPADFNDYANFVGALATHYKGRVQAYEIWNEPNIRREWNGRPLSAASYVEMLRLAYAAIKRANSSALVISAGLSPTGFNDGVNAINDRVFLQQAYVAGLASYSDAVGIHPGGWANPPDSTCCTASPGVTGWFNDRSFYFRDTIKDYRDIMTRNNAGSTFMWATEFGWGSSEGVVTDPTTVNPNFGFVKLNSQVQQAQYIPRAFELARTLGYVGPMFVYNLNYCQIVGSQPTSSEFRGCYYSLLDPAGNPRPAYNALKAAATAK